MKRFFKFAPVMQVQLRIKTLGDPVVEAVGHAETAGFSLFKTLPIRTAFPSTGLIPVKCLQMGFMICYPVDSQIYNTDTSTNAIRSGESILLKGGKGVDLLFPDRYQAVS